MKLINPILPGFYPDPSIIRVGADYFLATSSFEYFPGIPIFHSRDLVNWRQIGHCLTRKSQLNLDTAGSSGGLYAPTLRYHNGRFYMITTNVSHKGNFYVYTDDIYGEWSDPIWIEGKYTGHDPDLFFDDDGKVYYSRFSWGDGILLSEIDIETGNILSEPMSIWKGFEDRLPEGPHIYKINGLYYLLVAEGGTARGHMAVISRSKNIWGPYEGCPHNPILSHRAVVCQPIIATGHGDLVQTPDGCWWMAFLAIRHLVDNEYHTLGRETFLAPVKWSEEGWPVVNSGKPITFEMEAEGLPESHPFPKEKARDDFDGDTLRDYWNYRFSPIEGCTSHTERKGWLTLLGTESSILDGKASCFIGRRQQHVDFTFRALLEFSPANDGEEAGVCAFMNERHVYMIAVSRQDGERKLMVRKRIGDMELVAYSAPLPEKQVILSISGDTHRYHFSYKSEGQKEVLAADGDARYLSTEVAGGFTGVYLGLYATGNGKKSQAPAYFDWVEYLG